MLAFVEDIDTFAFPIKRQHRAFVAHPLIAGELRLELGPFRRRVNRREIARSATPLALTLHVLMESFHIQLKPALAGDIGGQIDRKSIGIVELEYRRAGYG